MTNILMYIGVILIIIYITRLIYTLVFHHELLGGKLKIIGQVLEIIILMFFLININF